MSFIKQLGRCLIFLIIIVACVSDKKKFSLQVQLTTGVRTTKDVVLDLDNLRRLGLTEQKMTRVLAVLDKEEQYSHVRLSALVITNQIVRLELDGKVIPLDVTHRTVISVLYPHVDADNNTLYVNREYFANRSVEHLKEDFTLKPLQPIKLWDNESFAMENDKRSSDVLFYSGRAATSIFLSEKRILSETVPQDAIINSSIALLAPPMGLHLKVWNRLSKRVVFKWYVRATQANGVQELIQYLSNLTDAHLVMLTTLVDISTSLSEEERKGLEGLGSSMASSLRFGDLWCWVWISGGATLLEMVSQATVLDNRPLPVIAASIGGHVQIDDLLNGNQRNQLCPAWPNEYSFNIRRMFCEDHEGYKELCDCRQLQILTPTPKIKLWKERLAILILTKHRPHYLYRLLLNLLSQPGVSREEVLCCVDGVTSLETLRLLEVLNITAVVHAPEGSKFNTMISRHLRFTLFTAHQHFNTSVDKFVILEDDLLLAPDFFTYMQQTTVLLDADPSLYSVSAYNAHAFPHTARNTSRLYRDDGFPAYGWMITRAYIEEVLPLWPETSVNYDWDYWMGMGLVRGNRSVVVPEVPRVRHGGISAGAHVAGMEAVHLLEKPVSEDPDTVVDTDSVLLHNYEQESLSLLQRARPFNFTGEQQFPTEGPEDVHLIYISPSEEGDTTAFRIVAHALGIWCYDMRGGQDGLWRLPYYNTTFLILALPTSKYRKFVYSDYPVVLGTADDLERVKRQMEEGEAFKHEFRRSDDFIKILFNISIAV